MVIHNHAWRSVAGKCHRPLSVCCISFENFPGGIKNTSGGSSSSSTAEIRNRKKEDTNEDKEHLILFKEDCYTCIEKKRVYKIEEILYIYMINPRSNAYLLWKSRNAWLVLFAIVWRDAVPKMPVDDPASNHSSQRTLCYYGFLQLWALSNTSHRRHLDRHDDWWWLMMMNQEVHQCAMTCSTI